DGAVHEIVYVERLAVGGYGDRLWRAADVDTQHLRMRVRIDDGDLAAGLERDEQVDAVQLEGRGTGHARIVVIDPCGGILGARCHVDARADRANGVLEVQSRAIAQRAPLDVVLLRRDVPLRRIGRYRERAQIVRNAATLVLEVVAIAVRKNDA